MNKNRDISNLHAKFSHFSHISKKIIKKNINIIIIYKLWENPT